MHNYPPRDRPIGYEYYHHVTLQERIFFQAFSLFHARETRHEHDQSAALVVTFPERQWFGNDPYQRIIAHYEPMDDEDDPEVVSLVLFNEDCEVASYIITLQRLQKRDDQPLLFADMMIPDDPRALTVKVDDMFPTIFTEEGDMIDDETALERILAVLEQSRAQLTFLSKDVA